MNEPLSSPRDWLKRLSQLLICVQKCVGGYILAVLTECANLPESDSIGPHIRSRGELAADDGFHCHPLPRQPAFG